MYRLLGLLVMTASASATYVVSVYGDVLRDREFFTRTFPWLIDNIGGDITTEYYLQGSGRYSVPQMCALGQLNRNTFLQAEFLKCEAEGTHPEICLCNTGIDPDVFRRCVAERGNKASQAADKYTALNINASPVLEMFPKLTVFEETDAGYLKKICAAFSDEDKPRGCLKPLGCDNNTLVFPERKAVAYFDCYRIDTCDSTHNSPDTSATSDYTTNTPEYTHTPRDYTTGHYYHDSEYDNE